MEIQPLFYTCLPIDIIHVIYNQLVKLKNIHINLALDIKTFNLLYVLKTIYNDVYFFNDALAVTYLLHDLIYTYKDEINSHNNDFKIFKNFFFNTNFNADKSLRLLWICLNPLDRVHYISITFEWYYYMYVDNLFIH